eukprot:5680710-Prymnesium_polylepis.4
MPEQLPSYVRAIAAAPAKQPRRTAPQRSRSPDALRVEEADRATRTVAVLQSEVSQATVSEKVSYRVRCIFVTGRGRNLCHLRVVLR